jgi:hypothetical protein
MFGGAGDDPVDDAQPPIKTDDRLPENFKIYSVDCGNHWVEAIGVTVGGVWTETHLEEVYETRTRRRLVGPFWKEGQEEQ